MFYNNKTVLLYIIIHPITTTSKQGGQIVGIWHMARPAKDFDDHISEGQTVECSVELSWAQSYFCDLLATHNFEPDTVKFTVCSQRAIKLYELQPRERVWVEVSFASLQDLGDYDAHIQTREDMEMLYGLVLTHFKAWGTIYGRSFPDHIATRLVRDIEATSSFFPIHYPRHEESIRRHHYRWYS